MFYLFIGAPFVIVMLLPGLRTWFLALLGFFAFLIVLWPRCQVSGDVGCGFSYAIFTLIAQAYGAALLARGVQLILLPWQQGWVRLCLGIGSIALAVLSYGFIW